MEGAGKAAWAVYGGFALAGFGLAVYVMLPESITGNPGPWVKDCEEEIQKRLIFPASYHYEGADVTQSPDKRFSGDNALIMYTKRVIVVEFTSASRDNSQMRNIATCEFTYKHALPNKTLGIVDGNIKFKYQ